MATLAGKRLQLFFALSVFLTTVSFVWIVDSAMVSQYRILGGCWPASVEFNGDTIQTELFWSDQVEAMTLNPVSSFFYNRTRHRILFYLIGLCALIGWSASVFLQIARAGDKSAQAKPKWETLISSLLLASVGAAILFLLFVSTRLIFDPNGDACISQGYAYLAALSGLACGLYVLRFFDWFESKAIGIWRSIGDRPDKPGG